MSHVPKPAAPDFVPALGHDWLTPFYDVVAWLLGDRAMKQRLIAQAGIAPGHDVLDLGCGTGTLALMIKDAHPAANVSGVDIDPRILAIARGKVAAAGVDVRLVEGSATAPPLPPASFDRVLSSLVLHHLTTPQKRQALAAARQLLRPGGELHVADWGKPQNALMQLAALSFRLSDGHETTGANVRGELPGLIADAGFTDVREVGHRMTPFGTLTYLRARVA
jgi:ubiquinone/menaquinone biosynthesis C-methylase UbiE